MIRSSPRPPRRETEESTSQPSGLNTFGKYELIKRLARGGMAETFRAQMKGAAGVTKTVVIKKVLPNLAEDEAFIASFINEAKLSASLSHGNIAQVFDFGQVDGDYFIAMELVDGRSLGQMFDRAASKGFQRLPPPIACFLTIEILKGLYYAHTRNGEDGLPLNLVHRDVTPENVLVSYEGQTKVVDFGVAKAVLRGRAETEPGLVKGKFLYFSPEQACAEPLDGRSDVFAVGVMLYRMLCGVLPFEGQMHNVMRAIVVGNCKPPLVVNPQLPVELADIIAKAMATDRAHRYANALEMQEALSNYLFRLEPSFSGEMIREWMGVLFAPELEKEGRKPKPAPRFEALLKKWDPHSKPTAPNIQAVTRDDRQKVEQQTMAKPKETSKGALIGMAAGAVALVLGAVFVADRYFSEPEVDPNVVVPVKKGDKRAERAAEAVRAKALETEAVIVESPEESVTEFTRQSVLGVVHQASYEASQEKIAEEDQTRQRINDENAQIMLRAREAAVRKDYPMANLLARTCRLNGKECAEAIEFRQSIADEQLLENAVGRARQAVGQAGVGPNADLANSHIKLGLGAQTNDTKGPGFGFGRNATGTMVEDTRHLIKTGEYPLAVKEMEMCLEDEPRNAECHRLLGVIYGLTNQPDRSTAEYKEFLDLAPKTHPEYAKVSKLVSAAERR